MPISEKLARLLGSLKHATLDGRLQWVEGLHDNHYKVKLKNAIVYLEFEPSRPGSALDRGTYGVMLNNPHNELVEYEFFDDEKDPNYRLVRELFEAARKNSPRFNEFLDRVIAEVDSRNR